MGFCQKGGGGWVGGWLGGRGGGGGCGPGLGVGPGWGMWLCPLLHSILADRSPPIRNSMGLLPDTQNGGLRMHRGGVPGPFSQPPTSKETTGVEHVPWCMPRSLIRSGGENVTGIPGACATRNFAYLVRGPWAWPCWSFHSSGGEKF